MVACMVNVMYCPHHHNVIVLILTISTDTTDVQEVKIVFYNNRLFLNCTYRDDSKALGCALKLTVSGSNETEEFNIFRKDEDMIHMKCFDTDNQLEAYGNITVFDIEEDGLESNTSLTVVPMEVLTTAAFTRMTKCPSK